MGRPDLRRPGVQAGRQQHRRRAGAAVGHAQRRRRLLPDPRLGDAGPARPEQRVHRRRPAVPRRHRQLERREDQQVAATPTASRSSRSRRRRRRGAASGRSCGRRRTPGASPARRRSSIGGPAAGRPAAHDRRRPDRPPVLGTINNCAMGFTPWGTYLACEENFNGYFRNAPATADRRSSGATASPRRRRLPWYTTDNRFDADAEPNEPNRFGWVVEIDPFDPTRRRSSARRSAASSTRARGCRRPATAASSSTWATTSSSSTSTATCRNQPWRKAPQAGHQPARRRHPVRRQVPRRRHRRVAAADAGQPGPRRLDARTTS